MTKEEIQQIIRDVLTDELKLTLEKERGNIFVNLILNGEEIDYVEITK